MKNSLFFLLSGLLVLGTVALIVHFGTEGSRVNREALKDLHGLQQKSEYVTIRVNAPSLAEVHVYYGTGYVSFGRTPFEVVLPKSEVYEWGIEVAARTPSGTYPWWGCNENTPSKTTLVVEIDGVEKENTFVVHPWTCSGSGEGNLSFDLK